MCEATTASSSLASLPPSCRSARSAVDLDGARTFANPIDEGTSLPLVYRLVVVAIERPRDDADAIVLADAQKRDNDGTLGEVSVQRVALEHEAIGDDFTVVSNGFEPLDWSDRFGPRDASLVTRLHCRHSADLYLGEKCRFGIVTLPLRRLLIAAKILRLAANRAGGSHEPPAAMAARATIPTPPIKIGHRQVAQSLRHIHRGRLWSASARLGRFRRHVRWSTATPLGSSPGSSPATGTSTEDHARLDVRQSVRSAPRTSWARHGAAIPGPADAEVVRYATGLLPKPAAAGMTESTRLLEPEQPGNPRDRQTCLPEVTDREIAPQVVEYPPEGQTFGRQSPGKCPLTQSEFPGDRFRLRFGMRQKRRNGVLNDRSEGSDLGTSGYDRSLASIDHEFVEKRIDPTRGRSTTSPSKLISSTGASNWTSHPIRFRIRLRSPDL